MSHIQSASIGIPDTLLLMLLALVVFGPRRLPEIGRQIGKLMYEFRKVSNDFRFQMEEELRASEEADRLRKLQSALPTQSASSSGSLQASPAQSPPSDQPASPELPTSQTASVDTQSLPAVDGEVRAAVPQTPQISPPSTGDPVAAERPFRGRPTVLEAEPASLSADSEEAHHG